MVQVVDPAAILRHSSITVLPCICCNESTQVVDCVCSAGIVLCLNSLAQLIKKALVPESKRTITIGSLEFDSKFMYMNTIKT
jgi:hypothetical protein